MIALFVAFALVALIGCGAIVLDVGALYQERRELQNGADAAALAVARDCAAGACGTYTTNADLLADANADDGDSDVAEVCGNAPSLPACTDPPSVPDVAKYVRVTTSTRDAESGGGEVRFGLARIFGEEGTTVEAASVVAYGPPGGLETIPVVFSMCEYLEAVPDPDLLPTGPPFAAGTEHYIYFHGSTPAGSCPAGPSGFDLAGGFGWLETDGSCIADIDEANWVDDKTGVAVPSVCDPSGWQNQILSIPFYDDTNGLTGSNGSYHIAGFSSLYVSGYRFPGSAWPSGFACPEQAGGSGTCLRGHFVNAVVEGTEFGTLDLGTVMIKVIE